MAYNENKPQSTDTLQSSQADLLGNFQAIKTLVDVDHVTFGAAGQGKHAKITLPNSTTPSFGNDMGFYNAESPISGAHEIFVHHAPGFPLGDIPMTLGKRDETGWSYLPSGFLIKWGLGSGSGDIDLTFGTGATIPPFTAVYSVMITTYDTSAGNVNTNVRLRDFSATQIRVFCGQRDGSSATNANFRYLAIGI